MTRRMSSKGQVPPPPPDGDEQEPDPWGLGPTPQQNPGKGPFRGSARGTDKALQEEGIFTGAGIVRGETPGLGPLPEQGAGYSRISERIFDLPDPEAEYSYLEQALRLGTSAYESISAAVDVAEDNARRAHRLYVCARVDAERFGIDASVIEAGMRTAAVGELQREKTAGIRTKTITEGDTEAKVAAMFPDEHRDLAERKIKSRKMIEHLEAFAGLWRSRCYSLAKMLEGRR